MQAGNVWQGVYTEAQAERGHQLYLRECTQCHYPDLSGSSGDRSGPALKGALFLLNWEQRTVADLFDFIYKTMPKTRPSSLSPEAAADVIGFILRENGIPAGSNELTPDRATLNHILVTEKAAQ